MFSTALQIPYLDLRGHFKAGKEKEGRKGRREGKGKEEKGRKTPRKYTSGYGLACCAGK